MAVSMLEDFELFHTLGISSDGFTSFLIDVTHPVSSGSQITNAVPPHTDQGYAFVNHLLPQLEPFSQHLSHALLSPGRRRCFALLLTSGGPLSLQKPSLTNRSRFS